MLIIINNGIKYRVHFNIPYSKRKQQQQPYNKTCIQEDKTSGPIAYFVVGKKT